VTEKKKALLLLSGGLDSTIALVMMKEHNIEVEAVHFTSLFCTCGGKGGGCGPASKVAEAAGIKLHIVGKGEDYLEVVKKPEHGRGSNMNMCIDCRIYAFRKAKELMKKIGASFIITGEVVDQRPMSQHKKTMLLIEKEAGLKDLVLRPLCALSMTETIPEKEGWVDRAKLKNISGRSRKEQLSFAEEKGVKDYSCPAGGCLLTDPQFARRIKDLLENKPEFDSKDVALLKYGRHFRLDKEAKLVVGRNKAENEVLEQFKPEKSYGLCLEDFNGPFSILAGSNAGKYIELAAGITARYGDVEDKSKKVRVSVKDLLTGNERIVEVMTAKDADFTGALL
jgi:tRNA U34 2-thiouridine synthase MnmA/TrmU